jgi:1-acyl-sn-glycerol-3-phosphate acyltransferase
VTPPTDVNQEGAQGTVQRPDILGLAKRKLGFWERYNLRFVRRSFEPGGWNRCLLFLQRTLGQTWIHHSTKHLRRVHGLERLPDLNQSQSVIIVANHRSFFDLYVVTAEVIRRGMKKRIAFMVRSKFYYESPLGLIVNFLMSFLAMYPPIFRERKKAGMNVLALDELAWMLKRGGVFAGLHPEGTRKRDDDPYTFLPAQPGVGRVIQAAKVPVIPVFVSGLGNDLVAQVKGNWNGKGEPIHIVFGKPIDFGSLLEENSSPRLHRKISERCMEAIGDLGQEERKLREKAKQKL